MEGRDSKELVVDKAPKRIKELQFGVLSSRDVLKQAVVEVSDRALYDFSGSPTTERPITKNGPLDKRMGMSSRSTTCETCGEELKTCNGHFGHIRLALPVFHIGYLKNMVDMLHCICKRCATLLLPEHDRRKYLAQLRRLGLDNLQRMTICKKVTAECKRTQRCPSCNFLNGIVRKVPHHPLKIVHKRFEKYEKSTAKNKLKPPELEDWEKKFEAARGFNPDIEKHWKKVQDDMTPLRALHLFKMVSDPDAELLGMNPQESRPEDYIWQYLPIPPVTIRPSVAQESSTTEDDLTNKIGEIVHVNGIIKAGLKHGAPMQTLMEQWDFMGLVIAMYINSDIPGIKDLAQGNLKSIRGFCQRLKGKQGRFRGNLSGKRVDFSGRTVIGPDPNLGIDEVAVPERVAVNLTYPERVNEANRKHLQETVMRGKKHPGANYIIKQGGNRIVLEVLSRGDEGAARVGRAAENLQVGDIVERHLIDGDIVLFNRQPSLHKLSILSHRAKIRPWRTFRLNECVCNPYNADFDGDEMNLHVPQTEEARAEAIELMGVKNNLATPKNGTPIIAAIQDFITCAYLMSNKQQFFDRAAFSQIISYMFNAQTFKDPDTNEEQYYELPPPAILKPAKLWTGKQVFNILMRPSKKCKVLVNLEAPCKEFKPETGIVNDLNRDDAWLVVRNSEVMCGVMDKATVGDGKKDSVFYVIMRDYGPDYAVLAMNRLAKLSARWLSTQGFSIGIGDVTPGPNLRTRKQNLNDVAYEQCSALIKLYKDGHIKRDPGCDEYQTMENQVSGILSKVRQQAGDVCFAELSRWNAPMLMAKCGSKGSNINVSQMVAGVGQQMIANKRVVNGFDERTLPHFKKGSVDPDSKGYVSDSFFDGLNPTEFIFHAMSGREGLVDTAVKTAETGYMSRRLIKSLEDLSAGYDKTVRNSSQTIVQFQYGDDHLDPVDMEGKAKPVNFDRTYKHAVAITWDNDERCLLPYEIKQITKARLDIERKKYPRISLVGESMRYDDRSDRGIDDWESVRDFLDTVQKYIFEEADKLHRVRTSLAMLDASNDSGHGIDYDAVDNKALFNTRDGLAKLSLSALEEFIGLCLSKYHRSTVEPGHAVGAVGAQSIGEPGTQMTLKTFHFAGVAGMSITQGVPRIKEIINASKSISTPIITCPLLNPYSERVAQIVKSRIEKTYLRDVISHIDDIWWQNGHQLSIRVNQKTIDALQLDTSINEIEHRIGRTKGLKLDRSAFSLRGNTIRIEVKDGDHAKKRGVPPSRTKKELQEHFFRVQSLKRQLADVMISGYSECNRAVISKGQKDEYGEPLTVAIEGYGLRQCMTTEGVDGLRATTNNVMEVKDVLGIEAARQTIINEISTVMQNMDIDPRHMQLLADVMTYKGDVYGITRFGMAKMRDSVLQLASFEKTPDHLFDAAVHSKRDPIEGVSECIIMGQSMSIGTGSFHVVREMKFAEGDLDATECVFKRADDWMNEQLRDREETCWGAEDETLDEED